MKKLLFLICAYFFLVSFCDKPEISLTSTWGYAGGQYTPGNNIILDADNLKTSNYKIVISYDVDIKNKDGDETIYLTVSVPDIFHVDEYISGSNFTKIRTITSMGLSVPISIGDIDTYYKKFNDDKIYKNKISIGDIFTYYKKLATSVLFVLHNKRLPTYEEIYQDISGYQFVIDGKKQRKGSVGVILNIPKDSKYSNMPFRITATVTCRPNSYICSNVPVVETITHVIQMPYNNDINPTQKE